MERVPLASEWNNAIRPAKIRNGGAVSWCVTVGTAELGQRPYAGISLRARRAFYLFTLLRHVLIVAACSMSAIPRKRPNSASQRIVAMCHNGPSIQLFDH